MKSSLISIAGYDILGSDSQEGLRYAWKYKYGNHFVESAAFSQRSTLIKDNICGYTTSVSIGCELKSFGVQCAFCRTGNVLPFCGVLSYRDIAKQNIFMVLSDMNCEDHPELHNRPREFAYMGQGEPGLSYVQVRLAIELTNKAMKELNQKVYRHIFATSGVPESIEALKKDIKDYYTQCVTLHFSLHATMNRELLMPIDKIWSYKESLYAMRDMYNITGEKPCIGIMLFKNFQANNTVYSYSNTFEKIKKILTELNPQKHRISFCTYNSANDICISDLYPTEEAESILNYTQNLGFEVKLFSSFGQEKQTACGTLGGKTPDNLPSEKLLLLERETENLIRKII